MTLVPRAPLIAAAARNWHSLGEVNHGEDFADADFTSLGEAAVYLAQHEPGPGPALRELIAKVQKASRNPTLVRTPPNLKTSLNE